MDFKDITCNWICRECGRLIVLDMYDSRQTKTKCLCGIEYVIKIDLKKKEKND